MKWLGKKEIKVLKQLDQTLGIKDISIREYDFRLTLVKTALSHSEVKQVYQLCEQDYEIEISIVETKFENNKEPKAELVIWLTPWKFLEKDENGEYIINGGDI